MRLRCTRASCAYRWDGRLKRPAKVCPRCRKYTVAPVVLRAARMAATAVPALDATQGAMEAATAAEGTTS